jgi:mycothiol synthase
MPIAWREVSELSSTDRLAILDLLNRSEVEIQRESIDENRRRTVQYGLPGSHWIGEVEGAVVSYASLTDDTPATVEMVGGGFDESLAHAITATYGPVNWWIRTGQVPPNAHLTRSLNRMSRPLPYELEIVPSQYSLRPFDPRHDAAEWIAQNNSAFRNHPEQGAWTPTHLAHRMAEPWFDPSGFLLLFEGSQLIASCWTKVHEMQRARIGEIYVISVGPESQGLGLGQLMVSQGLETLRQKGVSSVMLYVDSDNDGAVALYERMGFTTNRVDHLYQIGA